MFDPTLLIALCGLVANTSAAQVKQCMMKVTPCVLEETVVIGPDFEIRPYYAGHVCPLSCFLSSALPRYLAFSPPSLSLAMYIFLSSVSLSRYISRSL